MMHAIHTSDLHGRAVLVEIEINANNEVVAEFFMGSAASAKMPLTEMHDLMRQVDTAAACLQAQKGTEGNDE